jgi:hypothetical protein
MKYSLLCGDDNVCCTVFLVLIFMKLKNAQQNYMQVSCTSFNANWAINVESTDFKSFTQLSKALLLLSQIS